jgi:hypothetical protein
MLKAFLKSNFTPKSGLKNRLTDVREAEALPGLDSRQVRFFTARGRSPSANFSKQHLIFRVPSRPLGARMMYENSGRREHAPSRKKGAGDDQPRTRREPPRSREGHADVHTANSKQGGGMLQGGVVQWGSDENGEAQPSAISKIIARSGLCSRRQAEKLAAEGRVHVNGQVVTGLAMKVRICRSQHNQHA